MLTDSFEDVLLEVSFIHAGMQGFPTWRGLAALPLSCARLRQFCQDISCPEEAFARDFSMGQRRNRLLSSLRE